MEGSLTLILDENRIEASKRKLANKSRYFASLFSHNFNDSHSKEHSINYDIALPTLQNFVEWIHDDEECVDVHCHSVKVSMTKFVEDNFTELLNLIQLSVLFMVDELTNDIVDIIVLCWLMPDKVIDVWLLAQELNVKVLQDICLSVCLDRFDELPLPLLVELNKENITYLLQNVNTRASSEYLRFVRNEWIQHHTTSDIPDVREERQFTLIQGVVVYKIYEYINKDTYLYTWNGNSLSKCVQLKTVQDSEKGIIGMQVTGRGFSVYTIGGEMGLGTGKFNHIIWRYCLISKKWYYQTKLPVPRRHMVAVFLKNRLVIAGGVGRHRLKLYTVDILDIHTGIWSRGAKVPESFTEVPPYCVMDGKLYLIKSALYIYYPNENYWKTILIYSNPAVQQVDACLAYSATLFQIGDVLDEAVVSRVDVVRDSHCEKENCMKQQCFEHSIIKTENIVHEDDSCELRYAQVAGMGVMVLNDHRHEKYQYLHVHIEFRRDFGNSVIPRTGCFKIIDPDTLYDTI
ncbi:PREDICTED: uncharacterized protein LOC107189805 [Dufourea novaeangliae]|uniref:uncharacterized protein LOC107189805 n=1 Tax=Dufourea novaeangliae TaxID=178035 RepID=UPI00076769EF|nr:PREDICTED: uncharacterized protein LOC107189805 [Dufourea novaeangliae]